MGSVLANGLDIIATGQSIHTSADLKKGVDDLVALASGSNITKREKQHADAIKLFAEG